MLTTLPAGRIPPPAGWPCRRPGILGAPTVRRQGHPARGSGCAGRFSIKHHQCGVSREKRCTF